VPRLVRTLLHLVDWSLRQTASAVIHIYRVVLSPFLGSNCRFYPSCSHYALTALRSKPFPIAVSLITRRLLKCHPYHPGGYDPLS
jgi:hypothetical protein